jgi:DNA-binding MarR family transcriptional regulator
MGDLNIETIADWEKFQQYISELQNLQERLRRLHQSLERRRTQKGALEESEKPVLEALALQRRSLEDIRRQLRVSLDDLFGILKSLYRKGYLELEVRRRE